MELCQALGALGAVAPASRPALIRNWHRAAAERRSMARPTDGDGYFLQRWLVMFNDVERCLMVFNDVESDV